MEKEKIKELVKEIKKNLGENWEVRPITANKVGGSRQGIECRPKEENYAMVLYPDQNQDLIKSGISVEEMGKYLANEAKKNYFSMPKTPQTAEEFKKGLEIQVINADVNEKLLKNAVHDKIGDIAVITRCRVATNDDSTASFIVTKDNAEVFQLTPSEIMEQAYKNNAMKEFSVASINDVMREMMISDGMPEEMINAMLPEQESPFYVMTNAEKVNGANAIVCPEALKNAYEKLGEPYYVLPSSTHEVLLVKESIGVSIDELESMVREVNTVEVKPEDLLSFKVFKYDGRKLEEAKENIQKISEAVKKTKILR